MMKYSRKRIIVYCKKCIKSLFFDTFVIALLSLCVVYCFDWSFLDPSSLYQTDNGQGVSADLLQQIRYKEGQIESDNIKLINIDTVENRESIAILLEEIYKQHPNVIGVDLEFRGLKNNDGDMRLAQAIRRIKDKAVFACSEDDNGNIRHSFFCDPTITDSCLHVDGAKEGLVSYHFDKTIRTYRTDYNVQDCSFPSFPAQMVLFEAESLPDTTEHLIRYAPIKFTPVLYKDVDTCNLKGCYVIVGGFIEGTDIHITPIGILHGAKIHAHTLNTIQGGDIEESESGTELWYTLLTCFFFALLLVLLDVITNTFEKLHCFFAYLLSDGGYLVLVLSLLFVIILISFSYQMFSDNNIYISLNDALISVVIVTGLVKTLWRGFALWSINEKKIKSWLRYSVYNNFKYNIQS